MSDRIQRAADRAAELEQLRRIDRAARAFVEAEPKVSARVRKEFDELVVALYDGRAIRGDGK